VSAVPTPRDKPTERTLLQIFGIPLILGVLSIFGLTAALLGEGPWHVASWAALAVPPALAGWYARGTR
jgi:uncharacterized membrane protein